MTKLVQHEHQQIALARKNLLLEGNEGKILFETIGN